MLLLFAALLWWRSASGETGEPGAQTSSERAESSDPDEIEIADSFEALVSESHPTWWRHGRGAWGHGGEAGFLNEQPVEAGWWFSTLQGSPAKVAQYQDLTSSPFWTVGSLIGDGLQTWDFSAAGLDREATDVFMRVYGPSVDADIQYQRYIRHTEPDRLLNFPQPVPEHANPGSDPSTSGEFLAEDLNVGQDYAIRVQQLKANFHGRLAKNAKWRLNVWSMRKSGERQALALSNSYDRPGVAGNCQACHVLSQRQEIDWRTVEIEPVVEARQGPVTVSFSLPIRSFNQSDQYVTRLYNPPPANSGGQAIPPQLGSESYPAGAEYPYALVPENLTQMRKLKISVDLAERTQLYALLHQGSTDNNLRNTRRHFQGVDLRLTDRTVRGLTWTGYAKLNQQDNAMPTELISGEALEFDRYDETTTPCPEDVSRIYGGCGCALPPASCVLGTDGVSDFFASDALAAPINYSRTTFGVNGRWKPFRHDRSWKRGLTCYGRYEFRVLRRGHAEFEAAVAPGQIIVSDETETHRHMIQLGMSQRWSLTLDSFVRYRTWYESGPLYGVRETNGTTNSMLPMHVDIIEIGGTWSPVDRFMASGTLGIESRFHDSEVAHFEEQDYPLTLTLWYAPSPLLSFSAGYAYNSNRIHQAITLGDDFDDGAAYAPATTMWGYGGRNHILSLGGVYRWTPRLKLRGDVQYVRGDNVIDSTVFGPPYVWPDIEEVVRNIRHSVRISAGFDYSLRPRTTSYLRYTYLDYEDAIVNYNSGTAHLLLAGLSASY